MRRRTSLSALLGLLSTLAVGLVATAPPAAAEEVLERPATGVWAVEGRGWGHGRGMSQWGAQGAASLGVGAEQIVSTYYPGTAREVLPAAPDPGAAVGRRGPRHRGRRRPPGLTATDLTTGASAVLPAGPTRWRVVVDAAGLHLQARTGTAWAPYALGGATTLPGPVRFGGPEVVRVAFANGTSRDYRGTVRAVRASATALQTVVVLPLEDYLLGVVPRESSASWHPAALQAQAIAARSYSANKRARVGGRAPTTSATRRLPGVRRHGVLHRRRRGAPRSSRRPRRGRPGDRRRRADLRAACRSSRSSAAATAAGRRPATSPTCGPRRTTGTACSRRRSTRGRPC